MVGTKRQQWEKASDLLKICRSRWVHYLRVFVYRPSCLARYIILNVLSIKVPQPEIYFFAKMNLCTCFSFFQQILPFYRLGNLQKNQASFVHDWVRRGVGLFLIWYHNLCIHVFKVFMWCKSVCDVKSGIDLLPFWFGCEQKMRGFHKFWSL